jgi:CO/xanthine dehydrogenase Mo-binding subunit
VANSPDWLEAAERCDSATSTLGFGGFGSRQTITVGSSVHVAAVKVREKALNLAGHMLEVSSEDLEIDGAEIRVKGAADLKVNLGQVAKASLGIAENYLLGGLRPGHRRRASSAWSRTSTR